MRVSFIHSGKPEMGSYKLRASIPAKENGWSVNDSTADVLILSKPMEHELPLLDSGKTIVVDFCDPHFVRFPHYRKFLKLADGVTCSSQIMGQIIASQGRMATVVGDCWDNEQEAPHFNGTKLVWFGHRTNLYSIERLIGSMDRDYGIRILCNAKGSHCEPLTEASRKEALAWADICVLPATEAYKNPNRAVSAIRAGCLVVAEPHPAYVGLPIYVGDIQEGIEWAARNPQKALELVRSGQAYVSERYSPKTVASAWKAVIRSACTSGVGNTDGKAGRTATLPTLTLTATCVGSPLTATTRM